jgi:aryl-alcohol dehydrogenase-like predicted oxidoreductase
MPRVALGARAPSTARPPRRASRRRPRVVAATRDAATPTDADDARAAITRRALGALTASALCAPTLDVTARASTRAVPRASTPLLGAPLALSRVVKGCWQLSGGHGGDRASDRTRGDAAVDDFAAFVDAGVTTFDTGPEACGYGPSELVVGEYLKTAHGKKHGDEIIVCTKLCCVGREQTTMTKAWVEENVAKPTRRAGVAKLGVVQLYWNDLDRKNYVDAALFLTDLKHAGKIDAVGLTNFDTVRMREMMDAGAEISTNQIQYSLLDRRPEKVMVDYCRETGVGLLPYGVVAGGLLSDKYLNARAEDVVTNTSSLRKYASVVGQVGGYAWYQSLLRTLRAVGDKHGGASIANVASKWVLDSPVVPAIIVGARNASHVPDHLALFDFDLDADDRAAIARVLAEGAQPTEDAYTWERGGRW